MACTACSAMPDPSVRLLESFAAGFHRFFISVHYLADKIKTHFKNGERWGVDITYVEEAQPLGTAGALGLLPPLGDAPLLMMNGDVLTSVDFRALLAFHGEKRPAATMGVRAYDLQVPYGVVEAIDERIQAVVEKPVHKFFVNAGVYVLAPETVKRVPKNCRLDMPTLLGDLIAAGGNVTMFPIYEHWLDIGQFDDFNRALARP
jgi:NDP-sugar pyrophosphorylase family protein